MYYNFIFTGIEIISRKLEHLSETTYVVIIRISIIIKV